MTGHRAPILPDLAENPLRAALARGDAVRMQSGPTLHHLLASPERCLFSDAIVAQIGGMIASLAAQIVDARAGVGEPAAAHAALTDSLMRVDDLRGHCQALALEWRLAVDLEAELALDPVLSPLLQALVSDPDPAVASVAMAVLAAQARFAQRQRRMQLSLGELPGELLHSVLVAAREAFGDMSQEDVVRAEARLRSSYDEGAGRLPLLSRLVAVASSVPTPLPAIEEAGVALWLSGLAARSGEDRDETGRALADPLLGRLLLTLRAAGVAPLDAERQALRIQPDAVLPRGLHDIGTREAAQWLAEARG